MYSCPNPRGGRGRLILDHGFFLISLLLARTACHTESPPPLRCFSTACSSAKRNAAADISSMSGQNSARLTSTRVEPDATCTESESM